MAEPTPLRNRDQDLPRRSGEDMGGREPLTPQPEPEREKRSPLPEEEPYERDRNEKRPAEEKRRLRIIEEKGRLLTRLVPNRLLEPAAASS